MQTLTLTENFQWGGIVCYPALAPCVLRDKTPFTSKVQEPSLCARNQQFRFLLQSGSRKSIPAMGASLRYISMSTRTGNPNLIHATSKNWNEATYGCGVYTQLNLTQKVYALDDELTMVGKPMTGAV
ncbi:hypothetical protein [Pseudomonas sp. GL-B-26]|uniref:hypothetical protein n=1 Tax=Pseudomonas sp. GL-B-26 TaxID=2832394 RepID=UPI001CBB190E|nr:hypothetical protein [Pseudomonas sp. GL-B-26]